MTEEDQYNDKEIDPPLFLFETYRSKFLVNISILLLLIGLSCSIASAQDSSTSLSADIFRNRILIWTDQDTSKHRPATEETAIILNSLSPDMEISRIIDMPVGNDFYVVETDSPEKAQSQIQEINSDSAETGVHAVSDFIPQGALGVYENVKEAEVTKTNFPDFNQRSVGVEEVHDFRMDGAGIGVAMLDTPINKQLFSTLNVISTTSTLYDQNGVIPYEKIPDTFHGSGTTSALISVAPGVGVYSYAVCFNNGCSFEGTILALKDIYLNHPEIKVVNMSFGGFTYSTVSLCDFTNGLGDGRVITASVGNDSRPFKVILEQNPNFFYTFIPAGCGSNAIIPVGSFDWKQHSYKPAFFSNYNLDGLQDPRPIQVSTTGYAYALAPSLTSGGRDNGIPVEQVIGGTSISSPFMAGIIAIVLQNQDRAGFNGDINGPNIEAILLKGAYCPDENADYHDIGCKPAPNNILGIFQEYISFVAK